jgi:hypothetical protein
MIQNGKAISLVYRAIEKLEIELNEANAEVSIKQQLGLALTEKCDLQKKLLKQALEALQWGLGSLPAGRILHKTIDAIQAIQDELEPGEQVNDKEE